MLHKILKGIVRIFLALPLIYLLVVNIKLYYQPTIEKDGKYGINRPVIQQLQHLSAVLQKGGDKDMQAVYPEGYMFLNALIGLAATDVAQTLNPDSELFQEQIELIDTTLQRVFSEDGYAIFPKGLEMKHGAFYNGWASYLLGRKIEISPHNQRDTNEVKEFKTLCDRMASAYSTNESPFLRSYGSGTWQADNVVCIASLALHDRIFASKYDTLIQGWLEKVKTFIHSDIGLIGHAAFDSTGLTMDAPRGSSQSLMVNFLIDIDSSFAREQFEIYKKHFLDYRFGLPGIREYPKGVIGEGDVDSGPILLDIGGAASIVGVRTFAKYGDFKTHTGLRNSIEGFGLGLSFGGKRRYLGGALPIADAFIAWVNSANAHQGVENSSFSRWLFHLLSLIIIGLVTWLLVKI